MAKTSKGLVFALIVIIGLSFLIFAFVEQTSAQIQVTNVTPYCPYTYILQNNTSTNLISARNCRTGIIDYSGKANFVIQSAINNTLFTYGSGTDFFRDGIYSLTSQINDYEGVNLLGENQGWIETTNGAVLTTNGNFPAVNITAFYHVINTRPFFQLISFLLFKGTNNVSDTKNNGIYENMSHTFDLFIDHVSLTQFYNGLYTNQGSKTRISYSTIEGNLNDGINAGSITGDYLLSGDNNYIRGNSNYGVEVTGIQILQLTQNQFILNTNGGLRLVRFHAPDNSFYNEVNTNLFDSNGGAGGTANIRIEGTGINVTVTGNTFYNETNTVPNYDIRLLSGGSCICSSNIFGSKTFSNKAVLIGTTNNTLITNNLGENPIGQILTPLFSGGSGVSDGNWLSPIGTKSFLTGFITKTNYTLTITEAIISSCTGTFRININYPNGHILYNATSLSQPITIPNGYQLWAENATDFSCNIGFN